MNIDSLIKEKFNKQIIRIEAQELLFKHSNALKVIDEIERVHGIILGLDFWQKCNDGDAIEVNSTAWDDINQGPESSKKTIRAARDLIGKKLPDEADYVSFVFADQDVNATLHV